MDALRQLGRQHRIENRHPLSLDHPLMVRERMAAEETTEVLESMREVRDTIYEQIFGALFESPGVMGGRA